MMITKIQLAAMSRVDVPENERNDFYLYVDEFQNFSTESFANILSEARKYRLNLIMAHQYIEQLLENVKFAVFGNVGTLVVFRVGAADAEELTPEFTPTFNEEDLVNLPKYHFYLKLMIDGIASQPFSARGLPPLSEEEKTDNVEKVIKVCREKYAKSRALVEDKITRWHSGTEEDELKTEKKPIIKKNDASAVTKINSTPEMAARKIFPSDNNTVIIKKENQFKKESPDSSGIYKFSSICARCGKETRTSFMPDGVRPVYCKNCLTIIKKEKQTEVEERKKAKFIELETMDNAENKTISLKDALIMKPIKFAEANRRDHNAKPDIKAPNSGEIIKRNINNQDKAEKSFDEGEEIGF